jgi:hypothetical protein
MLPPELMYEILQWKRKTAWTERKEKLHRILERVLLISKPQPWHIMTGECLQNRAWCIYFYVTLQGTVFCSKYYGRKRKCTYEHCYQVTTPDASLTDLLEEALETDYDDDVGFREMHMLVEEWYDREFDLDRFHYVVLNDQPLTQFIDFVVRHDRITIHVYFAGKIQVAVVA